MRLDEVMKYQVENKPRGMRLGDVMSLERIEITKELDLSKSLEIPDEQIKAWGKMGKIGYWEQAQRQDKTEMIPFNPEGAMKSFKLLKSVNRLKKNKYENTPGQKIQDTNRVKNYLIRAEEERIRGFTIGGKITQGVAVLPAYMVEFLLTGGAAAVGRGAVKAVVKPAFRQIAKKGILKFTTRTAGGIAGATVRTAMMPHRVVKSYADRQVNASLELTNEGLKIAEQADEKPFTSAMKGFGDVLIENFSEVTGPTLAKFGKRLLPKKMANAMVKMFKKLHPEKGIARLASKAGYHGFLEELGEERVGDFLRALTGVEDFGKDNVFDRIIGSIPDGEDMLVEAGVLAFPGALNVSSQQALKIIRKRRGVEEVPEEVKPEEAEVPDEVIDKILEEKPTKPTPAIAKEGVKLPELAPKIEKEESRLSKVEKPVISKEIVAEKIAREEVLTTEEKELYPDLADIETKIDFLQTKIRLTKSQQKQLDSLFAQVGRIAKEKVKKPPTAKKILGIKPAPFVKVRETTLLKERIKNIRRGIREGKISTKKEVKTVQTEIVNLLNESGLEAKDKAKFIPAIKNIQTQEQLSKILPEIEERIAELVERQEKTTLAKEIIKTAKAKVDPEYREQIDGILEQFDLKRRTEATKYKRQKRAEFIERQREEGNIDFLPAEFFADLGKKTLDEMTLEEVEQLRDQVSVLATVGATKDRLLAIRGEKDFQKRLSNVVEKIYKSTGRKEQLAGEPIPLVSNKDKGTIEATKDFISSFFAAHRKVEFICKTLGIERDVFETIQTGINKELIKGEESYNKLKEAFKLIQKDFKGKVNKEITIEGVPVKLTKQQMIGIALNNGNEGNRRRIINGNLFTAEQIEAITDKLTTNEKKFVSAVFEVIDTHFPDTVEVAKKLVGIKPKKVKGDYFPIIADKELSKLAKMRTAERDLFQDIFHITFVERRFIKARKGGRAPIDLNVFDVIFKHIDGVNHFNSLAIPIRDVQKIINNPRFRKAITNTMGESVYNQFPTWLRDIANPKGLQAGNIIDKLSQFLRHNATAAILGHRVSVSLLQGGSITLTINEIGMKDTINGVAQFRKNPGKAVEFVYSKSSIMKNRKTRFDREIRDFMKSRQIMKITQGKKSYVEILFEMIRGVDFITTMPSWLGAYEKNLAETHSEEEAARFADAVVRRTQPAGAIENLPAIMRGKPTQKLFTSFMTHFTNMHNQLVYAMDKLKYSQEHPMRKATEFARSMFWIWVIPSLLAGWIRSGFKPEDWRRFAQELVAYPFAGIIFIRDLTGSVVKGFDFGAPPGLSVFKEVGYTFQGKAGKTKLKHGVKAIGLLTGKIPTQWIDTIDGFIDLVNEETQDFRRLFWGESALEPIKKGLFKKPKEESIF